MSSVVAIKQHASIFTRHEKQLAKIVAQSTVPTPICIIQASFCGAWIALQPMSVSFLLSLFCTTLAIEFSEKFSLLGTANVHAMGS